LRQQCQALGIPLTTGKVKDVHKRIEIYKERLHLYKEAQRTAAAAKVKNENRAETHRIEKEKMKKLTSEMMIRQCWEACHASRADRLLTLIRRGCDPDEESPRGLTPLLCLIITESQSNLLEELLANKADVNAFNRYTLTPTLTLADVNAFNRYTLTPTLTLADVNASDGNTLTLTLADINASNRYTLNCNPNPNPNRCQCFQQIRHVPPYACLSPEGFKPHSNTSKEWGTISFKQRPRAVSVSLVLHTRGRGRAETTMRLCQGRRAGQLPNVPTPRCR
jgi:hypothetical protein